MAVLIIILFAALCVLCGAVAFLAHLLGLVSAGLLLVASVCIVWAIDLHL